jgi:hypothetical protein
VLPCASLNVALTNEDTVALVHYKHDSNSIVGVYLAHVQVQASKLWATDHVFHIFCDLSKLKNNNIEFKHCFVFESACSKGRIQ